MTERRFATLFLIPGGVWLLLLFGVPLGIVFAISFGTTDDLGNALYGWYPENYSRAFDPIFLPVLLRSVFYAVATVALRAGALLPSGGPLGAGGKAAFTVAFWVLALIAVGPAIEAFRMRPGAGDVARRMRAAGAGRGTPVPAPGVPAAGTAPADGSDTA